MLCMYFIFLMLTSALASLNFCFTYYPSSGNHERDWPGTGSFYGNLDSGGECGVLSETMFYVPAENRAKFWYDAFIMSTFHIAIFYKMICLLNHQKEKKNDLLRTKFISTTFISL